MRKLKAFTIEWALVVCEFVMNDSDPRFYELFLMDIFFHSSRFSHCRFWMKPKWCNEQRDTNLFIMGDAVLVCKKISVPFIRVLFYFILQKNDILKNDLKAQLSRQPSQHVLCTQHLNSHDRPLFSHNSNWEYRRRFEIRCCSGEVMLRAEKQLGVHNSVVC